MSEERDRVENCMDHETPVSAARRGAGWRCPGTCGFVSKRMQQAAFSLHRGYSGAAGAEMFMENVFYWLVELLWKVVEPVRAWGFLEIMSCSGVSWGLVAQIHVLPILCFLGVDTMWPATSCSCSWASSLALSTVAFILYLLHLNGCISYPFQLLLVAYLIRTIKKERKERNWSSSGQPG